MNILVCLALYALVGFGVYITHVSSCSIASDEQIAARAFLWPLYVVLGPIFAVVRLPRLIRYVWEDFTG